MYCLSIKTTHIYYLIFLEQKSDADLTRWKLVELLFLEVLGKNWLSSLFQLQEAIHIHWNVWWFENGSHSLMYLSVCLLPSWWNYLGRCLSVFIAVMKQHD